MSEFRSAAHARREMAIRTFWVIVDASCWAFALMIAIWGRLDFSLTIFTGSNLWIGMGLVASIHAVVGLLTGPYLVRHMRGSFDEITALTRTALITALALMAIAWLTPAVFIPRSSALLAPALAIVLMLAARFFVRTYRSRLISRNPNGEKVIVFGAGLAGRRLVHNMLHDDRSEFTPVALLDDDRSVQLSLTGRGLLEGEDPMLADIRDADNLRAQFAVTRPDVVFHAAALKHLSLLERYPKEAWQAPSTRPPARTRPEGRWPAAQPEKSGSRSPTPSIWARAAMHREVALPSP
ncbi:hypothetical protein BJF80_04305 [Serinicoccus sp. CUA-874]|nr:hypothetical protein BJF80_04305 [Serinicoccus sp. CUA-874]